MAEIGEDASGSELSLTVGEQLTIQLGENRTTGYRWHVLAAGEPVCRLVDDSFQVDGELHGSPGTHRWTFQTQQAGQASIELAYRRPWEQDAGRPFRVTVRVSGG
jgi:inhibitor of cysteine peptidase